MWYTKVYEYHADAGMKKMPPSAIRKITLLDLPHIVDMEHQCFSKEIAYSPKQLKYLITKAHSTCLTEIAQDILRGFIIVLYKKGTQVAGIETLNVHPLFRGQGIGKTLLRAAEDEMFLRDVRRVRLEVSVGNHGAIKLYERMGFYIAALLPEYYHHYHFGSRDAYRMVKHLTT